MQAYKRSRFSLLIWILLTLMHTLTYTKYNALLQTNRIRDKLDKHQYQAS